MSPYLWYVVVTVATILANTVITVADLVPAKFVLTNGAAVGVPPKWLPELAALKGAGALGLLLGLLGVPLIGLAAAAGLVAFYIGAVVVHVHAAAYRTIGFPGAFLALAIGSLALAIVHL